MVVGIVGCSLVLAGCKGGLHRAGENQVGLTGSFGTAIDGQALWWPDADGAADNAGVTVAYNRYLEDRIALLTALTPYRNYNQSDGDATTGEFQLGLRWHFWEFELGKVPVGLFAEILGGIMTGSISVPEEGSHTNFTQDTGVGVEVQLADSVWWITGYRLRHLSNGRIFRSDSNPAQNDHHVYTGLQFSW